MEAKALYYPWIRVPEEGWFTRVLLYWDRVGTILPASLLDDPVVRGYTSELMDAHLLDAVHPEEYVRDAPAFIEGFFALIDGDEGVRERRGHPLEGGAVAHVHKDKLEYSIERGLVERGLADGDRDDRWLAMEPRTAGIYMAYLASVLGAHDEVRMDPVSDNTDLFVPARATPVSRAEALRLGVLEGILPGPQGPVPVAELVDFKERNADALRAFRNRIEGELLGIALIPDDEARARAKSLAEERLRQEIAGIAAEMSQRRWPKLVFGTIAGLASVAATAAAAVGTGGVALAFAAPGVISGAYTVLEGRSRRPATGAPLAYAALAQKTFGG